MTPGTAAAKSSELTFNPVEIWPYFWRTVQQLAARVAERYEVGEEQAAVDVKDFVESLLARGLARSSGQDAGG